MINLAPEICRSYEEATAREWLETNGLGSYASGTVSGSITRRYHGLLVVATDPPLERVVTLSKFEETLIIGGARYELSTNQYADTIHPDGYKYLIGFKLDPFPIWTYTVGELQVERSVFMVHGENSTVVQWKLADQAETEPHEIRIEIKPLVAFRSHHHLRGQRAEFDPDVLIEEGQVSIRPRPDLPRLYFASNSAGIDTRGFWYRNFEYRIEQERGFDHNEDLYQTFTLDFDLVEDATVVITTEQSRRASEVTQLRDQEVKRRAELVLRSGIKDKSLWPLVLAADQFVVNRGEGHSVLAGYHWFSDWGRDTMIALRGLTLYTHRPEIARSILLEYSRHISQGMIPNRFPDSGGTADYNTVDATLWFFEAIRAYAERTGDFQLVREHFYDTLADIVEWHLSGTRYQIHVDTDGLLFAGEPGVQLTWMDAKINGWVVTPRTGKAVEIQALWYNALRVIADLAERFGDEERSSDYNNMADAARDSFNGQFWNPDQQCLYDVVNAGDKDGCVRPNQILAVSLTHSMLNDDRARSIVDKVGAELLTPFGLRSLSPFDPKYAAIYQGSPQARDASYHQGTVWAWLIGPFIDAYRRVHAQDEETEGRVNEMLSGLRSHLSDAMVGQVSEIFDAEPPYRARGCGAQAWSVAELLRVLPK